MNDNKERGFSFSYSAKDQAELKRIREKYLPSKALTEMTGIEKLRQMDAKVNRKASIIAITVGVTGALVMGLGMSLVMTDISAFLKLDEVLTMILGILIGFIGIAVVVAAYPIYKSVSKRERKKIAPKILRLADELLNNGAGHSH